MKNNQSPLETNEGSGPVAYLKYNLEDRYQRNAHMRALKADSAYIAFHDIDNFLRNEIKYNDEKNGELATKVYEEVRAKLHEILEENGINLSDLE